jgi:hypothetical protein
VDDLPVSSIQTYKQRKNVNSRSLEVTEENPDKLWKTYCKQSTYCWYAYLFHFKYPVVVSGSWEIVYCTKLTAENHISDITLWRNSLCIQFIGLNLKPIKTVLGGMRDVAQFSFSRMYRLNWPESIIFMSVGLFSNDHLFSHIFVTNRLCLRCFGVTRRKCYH